MIYTDLKKLSQYKGISHNLDTAIKYLEMADFNHFQMGRNEVDGDNVYINCMEYETIDQKNAFFEAHERYLDLHFMLSGKERIGIANTKNMSVERAEPENDFVICKGVPEFLCPMDETKFLIAFPEDAHMVKVKLGETQTVKKMVAKIKIDWK